MRTGETLNSLGSFAAPGSCRRWPMDRRRVGAPLDGRVLKGAFV